MQIWSLTLGRLQLDPLVQIMKDKSIHNDVLMPYVQPGRRPQTLGLLQDQQVSLEAILGHTEPQTDDIRTLAAHAQTQFSQAINKIGSMGSRGPANLDVCSSCALLIVQCSSLTRHQVPSLLQTAPLKPPRHGLKDRHTSLFIYTVDCPGQTLLCHTRHFF